MKTTVAAWNPRGKKAWPALLVGFAAGLLVGAGMLVGAVAVSRWQAPFSFPETIIHASATHGGATMAMATGAIDPEVEGVFVLDFITGELQCSVLNPRTGQIGGLYRHNVVADLGVSAGKQPQYLMVTGRADFRYQAGNINPAQTVVYVADANTGRYAAYALPWNRAAKQYNFAQVNNMILLGVGAARNIQVE